MSNRPFITVVEVTKMKTKMEAISKILFIKCISDIKITSYRVYIFFRT